MGTRWKKTRKRKREREGKEEKRINGIVNEFWGKRKRGRIKQ